MAVKYNVKYHDTFSIALFACDCLGYSGPFVFPYEFLDWFFSIYVKNDIGVLTRIALNL
jgi:hypothetical protein